ncbi:hypothetical protein D3C81_1649290 [compost metagenome]
MALHVQTDMRSTPVNPTANPSLFEDGRITLNAMQQLVGGYIQVRTLHHHINVDGKVYVAIGMDEDGKMKEAPRNVIATELARKYGAIGSKDFIVGNAVLFEAAELQDGDDDE